MTCKMDFSSKGLKSEDISAGFYAQQEAAHILPPPPSLIPLPWVSAFQVGTHTLHLMLAMRSDKLAG